MYKIVRLDNTKPTRTTILKLSLGILTQTKKDALLFDYLRIKLGR